MRCISHVKVFLVFLILVLLGAWLYISPLVRWQSLFAGAGQFNPTPEQVQGIVNNISLVVGLSTKQGEPQWDEHAIQITKLGRLAAPYLVDKLTDESPSKVFELFPYAIGDVALALLADIYQTPSWPSPDGSIKIPKIHGDFRDYLVFVKSKGARERIKKSWKYYIQTH
jgi:hypothetical protein